MVPMLSPAVDSSFHVDHPESEQEIKDDEEFEFEFSSQFEKVHLSTADVLFSGGKIKPLIQPQPKLVFALRDSIKRRNERIKHERELSRERKRGNGLVLPLRVGDILVDDKPEYSQVKPSISKLFLSKSFSFPSSYKKWKLKDLFRSSSEGRSSKYLVLDKKGNDQNDKSSSFWHRRKEVAVEGQRRKLAATEVRWKTTLPYKHGLLAGCLGGHR